MFSLYYSSEETELDQTDSKNSITMEKINAIIVDDEHFAVETLEWELEQNCPEVKIMTTCNSAEEAINSIGNYKPELVFLDIEMPHMNAFEMLEKLDRIDFDIIFTTAYNEFAIKAIKVSALDYLLKPIGKEDLRKAVDKMVSKKDKGISGKSLRLLMREMLSNQNEIKKIALPTLDGLELVRIDHVLMVEADSSYSHFHLLDGKKIMISRTLKVIEEMLIEYSNFLRVHQSWIININHVERYNRGSGGSLTMDNKAIVPVARSKKSEVLDELMK